MQLTFAHPRAFGWLGSSLHLTMGGLHCPTSTRSTSDGHHPVAVSQRPRRLSDGQGLRLLLVWFLALGGCGGQDKSTPLVASERKDERSMGGVHGAVVALPRDDSSMVDDSGTGGTITVDTGCIYLEGPIGSRTLVVWPAGTTWVSDSEAVVTESGVELLNGDTFSATGTFTDVSGATSMLGSAGDAYIAQCAENDVAVVRRDVRLVRPPSRTVPPTTTQP